MTFIFGQQSFLRSQFHDVILVEPTKNSPKELHSSNSTQARPQQEPMPAPHTPSCVPTHCGERQGNHSPGSHGQTGLELPGSGPGVGSAACIFLVYCYISPPELSSLEQQSLITIHSFCGLGVAQLVLSGMRSPEAAIRLSTGCCHFQVSLD